mmetsp:Transcript_4363/g.8842  ORF Transcript_4363/g.8842 Transcript_4363/m.8842 type:complete len:84 (+) Transcript_4363:280-531(+)
MNVCSKNDNIDKIDKITALNGLSFDINPNECFVLMGNNGAGKSTLFKILLSEISPTTGQIVFHSEDLHSFRSSVGYCPQNNSF